MYEKTTKNEIRDFTGEYFFLSNFYETPILYNGNYYRNTEAAFQAMKCPERADSFTHLNPSEAKKLGRQVRLRADWELVKEDYMYEICKTKFEQHSDLKARLLATGDAYLCEGNTWGDCVWGVCGGVGENKLGKILMRIRDELRIEA